MPEDLPAPAPRRWFQPRPWTRAQTITIAGMFALCVVLFIYSWVQMYQQGRLVVGQGDLESCIAIARLYEPDLAGVTWTRRTLSDEERAKTHKEDREGFFGWMSTLTGGWIQRYSENGPVEAIGTKDGKQLFRVTVRPGPFGIGWTQSSFDRRQPPG